MDSWAFEAYLGRLKRIEADTELPDVHRAHDVEMIIEDLSRISGWHFWAFISLIRNRPIIQHLLASDEAGDFREWWTEIDRGAELVCELLEEQSPAVMRSHAEELLPLCLQSDHLILHNVLLQLIGHRLEWIVDAGGEYATEVSALAVSLLALYPPEEPDETAG